MTNENEKDNLSPELIKSLIRFQGLCPPIQKNNRNSFQKYEYANLDDINIVVKSVLTKCNLVLVHQVSEDDILTTTVFHVDGGHISNRSALLYEREAKNVQQEWGKALTYTKRYNTCALLNLVTGDQDFDAFDSDKDIEKKPSKSKKSKKTETGDKSPIEIKSKLPVLEYDTGHYTWARDCILECQSIEEGLKMLREFRTKRHIDDDMANEFIDDLRDILSDRRPQVKA